MTLIGSSPISQYSYLDIVTAVRAVAATLGHAPSEEEWRLGRFSPSCDTVRKLLGPGEPWYRLMARVLGG